jgi:GNAT superfamily N-acetyltransferase
VTPTAVRPATPDDRAGIDAILTASWGIPYAARLGELLDLRTLPAIVAPGPDGLTGVLTYRHEGDDFEVVSIDAMPRHGGVGTQLLRAAAQTARGAGVSRLWLVTTNDNLDALRFYQRRGLRLAGVHPGAVARSRELKPAIPETGAYGIPIRDEIVLELPLA